MHWFRTIFAFLERYERHLSGIGMIGGFAFDNYAFRRIDLPNTQLIFIAYLTVSAAAIALLHFLVTRTARGLSLPRWHGLLPLIAQFALGGLWSGFLVFYSRGAVFTEAWPFMLVLTVIFIGNEVLKKYYSRLVFTSILLFFGIYSYAIVTLPIVTGTIGTATFVASGVLALALFAFFLWIVSKIGLEQWRAARWQVLAGTAAVFATLNAFYFTGILPPLPLAMSEGDVYHFVEKTGNTYRADAEPQSWLTHLGASPVLHVVPGDSLYVYSAVFAPIRLSTTIEHLWQHYDEKNKSWVTLSRVAFPINGGRDGGYRGYTIKHRILPGLWRVDVDTLQGHIIGRVRFTVEAAPTAVAVEKRVLD